MLCVNEGDTVTITLKNALPGAQATSLVFPAISDVQLDGHAAVPSPTDIAAGNLAPAILYGKSGTYSFVADHAGTFLYESGTQPELQDQMGLVGALIVRPKATANGGAYAYSTDNPETTNYNAKDKLSTRYNPAREFVHLLSEIDPDVHQCFEAAMRGQIGAGDQTFANLCPTTPFTYDLTKYKARYYMINGRSFPDTIAPNNSQRLPSQPYGSLVHVRPNNSPNESLPALVRYVNAGPVSYPFHPHVQHEQVIGVDGRKLVGADGSDLSIDRFDLVVPPGGTIDSFFSWHDAEGWDPTTRSIGVPVPDQQNRNNGAYWNGSPYLGVKEPPLPGAVQFNECGEYYNVAHSHALFEATNYGAAMGGMLTMIRIDPPGGCP
jgi:FtsP/CotA-like multicopper oxidase with cupredoxin domain